MPRTEIDELGLFTLQRLDRGGWGVEGGLRLDRRRLESAVADRAFTNVSATAGVFFRPATAWFLGLSASRTARAPTESELFANGPHVATRGFEVGDADLSAETAFSIDAAAHYENGPFSFDVHLFTAHYSGFIDLAPTGAEEDGLAVFAYRQIDADFHGGEIEAAYEVWREAGRLVTLEGEADLVRADSNAGRLPRIPPSAFTGRVRFEGHRWSARAEVRRVAGQNRVAAFELPTDGHTQLNAYVGFRPWAERRVTLFVDGRNLADSEAREHVSFLKDLAPLPGRSLRFGIAASF